MAVSVQESWLKVNDKMDQSVWNRYLDYTETTRGLNRVLNAARLGSELWGACSQNASWVAQELGKITSTSLSGMGLVGLPSAMRDAYRGVVNIEQSTPETFWRNVGGAAQDGLEALASWCYAVNLFVPHALLGKVGQCAELAEDVADFGCSLNDYHQASELAKVAVVGDVQEALAHTQNYQLMRVVKTICAVMGGVFGVLALLTGMQILPAILAITLSLMSTGFAISLALKETEGRFKLIDFKQPVSVS